MSYSSNRKNRQVTRIKSILLHLAKNGPTSTKKLSEEFNCCMKTIQSDLRMLRDVYNVVTTVKPGVWKVTKTIRQAG